MTKQTKADLVQINADLTVRLREQTLVASNYHTTIPSLERQLSTVNRRFDQLLDGMCMGMKEANLPRRSV